MKPVIGLALTGSFCTIGEVLSVAETLTDTYSVVPIVSYHVAELETRFFPKGEILRRLKKITGNGAKAILNCVYGNRHTGSSG